MCLLKNIILICFTMLTMLMYGCGGSPDKNFNGPPSHTFGELSVVKLSDGNEIPKRLSAYCVSNMDGLQRRELGVFKFNRENEVLYDIRIRDVEFAGDNESGYSSSVSSIDTFTDLKGLASDDSVKLITTKSSSGYIIHSQIQSQTDLEVISLGKIGAFKQTKVNIPNIIFSAKYTCKRLM